MELTIIGKDGDTLSKLSYQYLGDFELWQQLADKNNIDAFTPLAGLTLTIPATTTPVSSNQTEFIDLSAVIKTANNWKSLDWV